jgi:Lrp/AsnC family transcriptional regulator, leucine-responsive regulatory protein
MVAQDGTASAESASLSPAAPAVRRISFSFSTNLAMDLLDDKDRALLAELQRDSRQTIQQLATAVGLSATPCWKRIKDLEAARVIRGYGALVDRESVGLALCVLAEVNLTQHTEHTVREFERAVAACPQIVSCYSTTGAADYSIKVLVRDIQAYESFLHDTAFRLPGVTHIRSSVVLKEVKAEAELPIERAATRPRAPARTKRHAPQRPTASTSR